MLGAWYLCLLSLGGSVRAFSAFMIALLAAWASWISAAVLSSFTMSFALSSSLRCFFNSFFSCKAIFASLPRFCLFLAAWVFLSCSWAARPPNEMAALFTGCALRVSIASLSSSSSSSAPPVSCRSQFWLFRIENRRRVGCCKHLRTFACVMHNKHRTQSWQAWTLPC